jgi:hypothetical protein
MLLTPHKNVAFAGDEHRGVKQVHGKCISCDRPLNIIRDSRLGSLSISIDAFGPGWPGPRGPGWETGPKRALGNRDMEAYWELLYVLLLLTVILIVARVYTHVTVCK